MQRAILTGGLLFGGLSILLIAANHMPAPVASSTLPAGKASEFMPPRKHAPMPPRPRPPRGKFVALVYAGNGQGEVEPCG